MARLPKDSTLPFDDSNPHIKKYIKQLSNPILQRLFLFAKLPSASFMGIRVKSVSPHQAKVTVPYKWRSQNPFKSTYFAAQAAAAEMSTGVLAMLALQGRGKISMLITNMEATYGKKAVSTATFTCLEGQKVIDTVQKAIETGEAQDVTLLTIGTQIDKNGQEVEVSRFLFTWSFKVKK
jgi:acyl-coenzyme A thioesterase PaaI-like protein